MNTKSPELDELMGQVGVEESLEDERVRAKVRERLFGGAVSEAVRVDRFTLLDRLGQGAMGVVYAAYDPKLDRRVALKFVRIEGKKESSEAQRKRLVGEARAAAKLSHPNVLSVYDVGESGERVFIAMEYVEGQTLAEWMAEPRQREQIVDVFVQAGRGLGAAHAAGMVHRDFKPANVLIGTDSTGQPHVRVADFGLALSIEAESTAERVGTPAYMAPEQHRGQSVDVRADQFAFCVALWEALYGERPFTDTSAPGELPAGRGKNVPDYLRAACARGLSAKPADRFESMDELLTCLVTDPSAQRRRWLGRGTLVALGAAVAVASFTLSGSKKEDVCPIDTSGLVGAWDDDRKRAIAGAFEKSGVPYWKTSWQTVQKTLDRYTAEITAGRKDACEATHVRKQQSGALLDRRVACLDARLAQLRALSGELVAADKKVVEKAVLAAARLPSVTLCSDVDALKRPMPLPSQAVSVQVDELQRRLARAKTLRHLGKYRESAKEAQAVVVEARTIGYTPLLATALHEQGAAETDGGEHAAASKLLEEAVVTAIAGRDDDTLARASIHLVFSLGYWQQKPAEAARWAKMAEAVLTASGRDPDLVATLRDFESATAQVEGKKDLALAKSKEAFELYEDRYGPEHYKTGRALASLGNAFFKVRKLAEAEKMYKRALTIMRRSYGDEHPRISFLLSSLGATQSRTRRYDEALKTLAEALRIKKKTLGESHPSVARTVSQIADALAFSKRYGESIKYSLEAITLIGKRLGPDHPMLINYHVNLGLTHLELEEFESAIARANTALAILSKNRKEPVKDARYLSAVMMRARGYLGLRQNAKALADFQTCFAMLDPKIHYADEIAHTKFGLAQTLVRLGRSKARAKKLATEAKAGFVRDKSIERVKQVEAWLAEQG